MNIGNVSRPSQPASGPPALDTRGDAPARTNSQSAAAGAAAPRRQAANTSSAQQQGGQQPQPELSRASVEKLVERISSQLRIERRSLSFTVDDELGKTVVKVIDRETEEVIRQIPSEELLRFSEAIQAINEQRSADSSGNTGTGLLIQEQA